MLEILARVRVPHAPILPDEVARKADIVTGEGVNYSLTGVDTGVKWVDGSSIYRRAFITATKDYPGQRVAIVNSGWGFRGLVRLSGYLIAEWEDHRDFLPIGFRGGSDDGTYSDGYIECWLDSDGTIYETHNLDVFDNRPLILIVDYIGPTIGMGIWDGGSTVWDGGASTWD